MVRGAKSIHSGRIRSIRSGHQYVWVGFSWPDGPVRTVLVRPDMDRGSKATLPLTIPRCVFKSSAKDSTRRSVVIIIQAPTEGHNPAHGSFAPLAFQPSAMTNCANQRFLSY
ncbi:hypothetical protein N665_1411s0017 [Sinapis alba]|nr:hypothetical protein N665_1411s0017 [Sinapis alba]